MGQKLRSKKVQDIFFSCNHSVPEGNFQDKRYVFQENSYPGIRITYFLAPNGGSTYTWVNMVCYCINQFSRKVPLVMGKGCCGYSGPCFVALLVYSIWFN